MILSRIEARSATLQSISNVVVINPVNIRRYYVRKTHDSLQIFIVKMIAQKRAKTPGK